MLLNLHSICLWASCRWRFTSHIKDALYMFMAHLWMLWNTVSKRHKRALIDIAAPTRPHGYGHKCKTLNKAWPSQRARRGQGNTNKTIISARFPHRSPRYTSLFYQNRKGLSEYSYHGLLRRWIDGWLQPLLWFKHLSSLAKCSPAAWVNTDGCHIIAIILIQRRL